MTIPPSPSHEPAPAHNTPAGRLRLSTDDLPERDRLGFWHECHGRRLCNIGIKADTEMGFSATADILPVGNCAVFNLTTSQASYYVAKEYLANAPEMTALVFVQNGQLHARQRNREITISSGQAFAILSNEVGSIDVMQPGSYLNIYLPTSAIAAAVPDLSKALLRPINENPASLRLLISYAATLQAMTTPLSPSLAATVSAQLSDLAAHLFCDSHQNSLRTESRLVRAARRQAIKADIATHLTQHDLSPDDVARRLGIMPRYMRKILRDEGTSFSDLLRHMRLKRAHQLLMDRHHRNRSISSIAYDVGFGDLSHFNRCFRAHFGTTPRDIRAHAYR